MTRLIVTSNKTAYRSRADYVEYHVTKNSDNSRVPIDEKISRITQLVGYLSQRLSEEAFEEMVNYEVTHVDSKDFFGE